MRHLWLVVIRWCSVAWVLFLAIGCSTIPQQTSAPQGDDADVARQLQDRQVIVTLPLASPESLAQSIAGLAQTYGLTKLGEFPLTALGVHCVRFQVPAGRSVDEAIARLAADPRVILAQRNQRFQVNQRFQGLGVAHNDPDAPWGAKAIRADVVHRWATGKGVKVAVVDTGVALEHPDLRGQIVNYANFVDGGERTFTQELHGTAVAGVIAARANNNIGIFGVAPEAAIVALKACWYPVPGVEQAECSTWTLCKALNFAIDHARVKLLNLSLGSPVEDPLLLEIFTTAEKRGITIVAAAVKPDAPGFPASLQTVIAVHASDPQGRVSGTAGRQLPRLLAAPGVGIRTTIPPEDYKENRGSSLAAAHVTGVAALLLQRRPRLSPAEVHDLLHATARSPNPSGSVPQPAIGVVDACAALEKLLRKPLCS